MVDPESMDMEVRLSGQFNLLFPLGKLQKADLKGKLGGDHPKTVDNTRKSFGADHQDRLRALRISHCQQHSRKTRNMVRMKMGEQHHIDGLGAPASAPERDLGAFSAVHQHSFSVVPKHQRGQIPIRQRHHPSCSEQTDINHIFSLSKPCRSSERQLYHQRVFAITHVKISECMKRRAKQRVVFIINVWAVFYSSCGLCHMIRASSTGSS